MALNSTLDSPLFPEDCPPFPKQPTIDHFKTFQAHLLNLQSILCIIGVLGNAFAISTLMRKNMRNNFNKLIIALSLFDTTNLLVTLVHIFTYATEAYALVFAYFLVPGSAFAERASIYMTVAIACQRFLAVRYPFKYGRKSLHQVPIYVVSVFTLALITIIPIFFEFTVEYGNFDYDYEELAHNETTHTEISHNETTHNATNEVEMGMEQLYVFPTDMKMSIEYKVYEAFGGLIIFGIIPFALLACFYIGIYKEIKASNSRTGGLDSNEENKKKEATLAKTFAAFVVTFFVCYTPQHVYRIYEIILSNQTIRCGRLPFSALYALEITQMLIVLNSAINVVIYTAVNNQFRNECKEMICKLIPSRIQQGVVQGLPSGGMSSYGPVTKTTDDGMEMQRLRQAHT